MDAESEVAIGIVSEIASDGSDEGELWFSDDELGEHDCSDGLVNFPWTVCMEFSGIEAMACRATDSDLREIFSKLVLAKEDIAAIYLLGHHLSAYARPGLSYKLLVVTYEEVGGARRQHNKTRDASEDSKHARRDHRRFFLDAGQKKAGRRMGRLVRATVESMALFKKRLLQHKDLLPVWLSADHVWIEAPCLQSIRSNFQVERSKLLKVSSAYYAISAKRLEKYKRKEDWSNARQCILKLARVLLLSLQIARRGKVVDYTCQPELGRVADGFNGPEIMSLADARDGRMQDDENDAEDSTYMHLSEQRRIELQWSAVVETLMERLRAACLFQPALCTEVKGDLGVPEAILSEDVQRLCCRFPPGELLLLLEDLRMKYERKQSSLSVVRESVANGCGSDALADTPAAKAMLEAVLASIDQGLEQLEKQLSATQGSIACAQQSKLNLESIPRRRRKCIVEFLINKDDVKKHTADLSIPDYYLDLVQYLGEERDDAQAHPVWFDKGSEARLCFSAHADIFYKHMGSASFFEKNRDFENSKFRRNQAVSAMTAPYTKKDGLMRILREYHGEKDGNHPSDARASDLGSAASSDRALIEVRFQPGQIGLTRRGQQVNAVAEDSQAYALGVKPGWLIDSVDGEPFSNELLKSKKDGSVPYTVVFVEFHSRVAAVAADNIAPRSFFVGTQESVETVYDDVASFEEEYIRGLAVAVSRRMLAALKAAEEKDAACRDAAEDVKTPFGFEITSAALAVLRFSNSEIGNCIYRVRPPSHTTEHSSDRQSSYKSAQALLLQEFATTHLAQYNDSSGWKSQLPYSQLQDLGLASVLDEIAAWDPQAKTLYGLDNLWILKPKGLGRGKGIFVAECAQEIVQTGGLDHLFSTFGLKRTIASPSLESSEEGAVPEAHMEQSSTRLGGYGLKHVETGWVAQKYIEKPLLVEGRKKFDIRFMALVSFVGNDQLEATPEAPGPGDQDLAWARSVNGGAHAGGRLTCYSFEDSVMKVCAADFNDETQGAGELRHLTNHAVQEHHPLYEPETGVQDSAVACAQGKLGMGKEQDNGPENIYYKSLLPQMQALAYRVFRATPWENDWARDEGFYPTDVRFQLFGFDMMVDEDYRVWVIEVNQQPGLSAEGVPAMTRIMRRLLRGMFGILLDVERYDLICSSSHCDRGSHEDHNDGNDSGARPAYSSRNWPESAAGWSPLTL